MNKKILVISISLIVAVLVFASCEKKEKTDDNTTTTTTTQQNTVAPVSEYSTKENGEIFVTNVKGDEIPVTKDSQGNVELPEDLVTKTVEQVSKEKEEIENQKTSAANSTTVASTASNGSISLGSDDPFENDENVAVIDWR